MACYSSKPVEIPASIDVVYERISNVAAFQDKLDQIPADVRAKMGDVSFRDDAIVIAAAPVGEITLRLLEKEPPRRVKFVAENSPVPIGLAINLADKGNSLTEATSAIEVDIPVMLKPLVGPKLQEAADKFGELLTNLGRMV